MDYAVIVLLIGAGLMTLVILVLGASILSARAFTQLADLIRFLGSLVERQMQDSQQVATTLLNGTAQHTDSVTTNDIPTTRDNPD